MLCRAPVLPARVAEPATSRWSEDSGARRHRKRGRLLASVGSPGPSPAGSSPSAAGSAPARPRPRLPPRRPPRPRARPRPRPRRLRLGGERGAETVTARSRIVEHRHRREHRSVTRCHRSRSGRCRAKPIAFPAATPRPSPRARARSTPPTSRRATRRRARRKPGADRLVQPHFVQIDMREVAGIGSC